MARSEDRRSVRTRGALISAFNRLLLRRPRKQKIRVSDIVREADVGRSTFYDHYASAVDIHMEALSRPFAILADAAAGMGDQHRLAALLDHFWENRQRARETFEGHTRKRVVRLLAELVEDRLAARRIAPAVPVRLAATQLAEAALAPVRAWVTGEAACSSALLARQLCRGGEALVAALEPARGGVVEDEAGSEAAE